MQLIDICVDSENDQVAHLLLGTVSAQIDPQTWADFERFREANPTLAHPMDSWGRQAVLSLISDSSALHARFPDDIPIFPLVSEALGVFPRLFKSPLGMIVSSKFGLMFGIRAWVWGQVGAVAALAAKINGGAIGLASRAESESPCLDCADQPCLHSCPVGAFSPLADYDYPSCVAELIRQRPLGGPCWQTGCVARAACPHSEPYTARQAGFHNANVVGD